MVGPHPSVKTQIDCVSTHVVIQLPGLVDTHVHVRDPGATHKEDWRYVSSPNHRTYLYHLHCYAQHPSPSRLLPIVLCIFSCFLFPFNLPFPLFSSQSLPLSFLFSHFPFPFLSSSFIPHSSILFLLPSLSSVSPLFSPSCSLPCLFPVPVQKQLWLVVLLSLEPCLTRTLLLLTVQHLR